MMGNVVIIGASASGHNIALGLKDKHRDCNVALLSQEDYPSYDHLKIPDLISGIVKEKDIFLCDEDFYQKAGINFLKNKKVSGINTEKSLVYFKDRGSINYDILVIASGRSPVIPDIPGARKVGAYRLYTLDDTKEFLKRFIAHPVCIVGLNSLALKVAEAIMDRYAVEVKILSSLTLAYSDLPGKIEVICDSLVEVIGEGEVQAIKLKSGKALGVCAVLFMDNYKSNIDFLKNTEVLVKDDFIVVDKNMATNYDNIFACGSVVGKKSVSLSLNLVDSIISRLGREDASRVVTSF
jgi:NAD(P)H-nitrite reductase large subunit